MNSIHEQFYIKLTPAGTVLKPMIYGRTDRAEKSVARTAVNFITILCAHFLYKMLAPKITKLKFNYRKLHDLLLYKKGAR